MTQYIKIYTRVNIYIYKYVTGKNRNRPKFSNVQKKRKFPKIVGLNFKLWLSTKWQLHDIRQIIIV